MGFRIGLENETPNTGAQDLHDDLLAIMHRVEENLDARELALQGMGKIQAVQLRNRIIKDGDIRPRLPRKLKTGPAVRGLADHVVVRRRLQQLPNSSTDCVMIVDNNDPSCRT